MKPAANTLLALILALILSACGGSTANSGAADTSAATGGDGLSLSVQESQEDSAPASPGAVEEGEIAPQPGQNAKLIRRAELYIQTEAFDEASAALEKLVAERGGYFQSAQVEGGSLRNQNAQRYGEYVIRLPQERFEDFLAQSGSLGYVVRQQESSENVSQAYYDTQTRLETQRTKQERLLALLAQADTMEAILELEDALSDVEYEIQSLSTDLEHYDGLVDYATVTLTLEEVAAITTQPGETAGLLERMGAGISASFQGFVLGVQDLLVWLSYHLFLVGAAVLIALGGVWYWRRKFRKKNGRPEDGQA